MRLYVKRWCPWCIEAIEWLDARGFRYELVDVIANPAEHNEMRRISGQLKTPTLEVAGGHVLPDFDVGQLEKFLLRHSIQP